MAIVFFGKKGNESTNIILNFMMSYINHITIIINFKIIKICLSLILDYKFKSYTENSNKVKDFSSKIKQT